MTQKVYAQGTCFYSAMDTYKAGTSRVRPEGQRACGALTGEALSIVRQRNVRIRTVLIFNVPGCEFLINIICIKQ
ncbi:hypothetical protein ABIC88_001580 [Pseudomonas kilonensis]